MTPPEQLPGQTETMLNSLIELSPIGVGFSRDGAVINVNRVYLRMFGYDTADEIRNRSLLSMIAPHCRDATTERIKRRAQGLAVENMYETTGLRRDGSEFPMLISATRITMPDGPITLAFLIDLTERQHKEIRFRTLFETTRDAVMLLDQDGRIIDCNKSTLEMFGCSSREALLARHPTELSPHLQADGMDTRTLSERHVAQAIATGSHRFEWIYRRADDRQEFPTEVLLGAMQMDGRTILQATIRDISERSRARMLALRYQSAINTTHDGFWLTDEHGILLDANQAYAEISGYARNELVGSHISRFEAKEQTPDEIRAHIARIIERGWDVFETRHRHKDGHEIELEVSASYIRESGQFVSFLRDTASRRKLEQELANKERKFRSIFDSVDDGIEMISMDGLIVDMNRVNYERMGYRREEVIGRPLSQFCTPKYAARMQARLELLIREGHDSFESARACKDGSIIPIEVNTRIVEIDGQPVFLGISRDISQRKLAEIELETTQSNLNAAQSLAHIGSWEWDVHNNSAQWSDETYRIFGIDQQELNEHRNSFIELVADEDKPRVEQALTDALSGEHAYDIEYGIRLSNGEDKIIHALGEVIRDADGKPLLMRGTVQDITLHKANEQRILFLSQIFSALSQTNQALIESGDESELFNRVCRIVVEFGGMELAWIGIKDEASGLLLPSASHGDKRDYLDRIVISTRDDVPEGRGPTGTAFREMRPIFVQHQKTDPLLDNWRQQTLQFGWGSSGTVPIMRGGKPYATLAFYHTQESIFSEEIISLLSEMARNIGRGLDRFDLESERRKSFESMQLAATIYQTSVEAIMVTDENNLIIDVNPAFTEITGYARAEVLGRHPDSLQQHDHREEIWQPLQEAGHWHGEIVAQHKNGQTQVRMANISIIRHPDGSIYRHITQFSDITDKKRKEQLIWQQANFDSLTGLPNRQMFHDRLEQEIKKSNRTKSPLALLFIDLDRFKEINDTLGHAKGDVLLIEAASRIVKCVRETDTVARLGGDEFTVVLPEFRERLHLERVVQEIIAELARPFDLENGVSGYISASVGITVYPDDAQDVESLLQHADQAMYVAKADGRNRFGYFTASMQQEACEKLALTNDLRQALARNELHVYYQPIVEPGSDRISKAEALLRWKHPIRGMVSPATFIPLAEESGLIHEIGEWVFMEVIAAIGCWRDRYGRLIQVSVNKSPVQFERVEGRKWPDRLNSLGLPGNSIIVEITEGLLLKDSAKAKNRLLEFRNRGIEVSIDDFGTGFSSLSYLKQFDIDYLKIDRSFIKDMTSNDQALTEAIIVMAHKLNIRTIAEGVETWQQRELLESFGCDCQQGYLYSPAVPAEEFEKMIAPHE